MKKAILITHKQLSKAIFEVVEGLAGHVEGMICLSNEGLGLNELAEAIEKEIQKNPEDFYYIMVELKGGSPYLAARKLALKYSNLYVLSGLNIPMMLSFVMKKDMYDHEELADVIRKDAHRGITLYQKDKGEIE